MHKVVIVGGGAAGMMAAISCAKLNKKVILIEKNEKLGKKIYITGKGRCNLTCAVEKNDFFNYVVNNPKFLFGAINALTPKDLVDFFENNGLELKEERGKRIFPKSDKASDVNKTLEKILKSLGVEIKLNTTVKKILQTDNKITAVITDNEQISCDSVVVCTGGISYPLTGSTGDGYAFARKFGHKIIEPRPALVGIELNGNSFLSLQGLSLKNVNLSAKISDKEIFSEFGELLFTHYGVSGPIVLSCSSIINKYDLSNMTLSIDLKPALTEEVLHNRLIREFMANNVKNISSVMRALLPKSLIEVVLSNAKISQSKKCSEITLEERKRLVKTLKNLNFLVKKLRPIDEAIITSGGVCVNEINPKTMESKIINGLYFAGEVLDVDAFTGGFNLQIAFSTGYVAGKSC